MNELALLNNNLVIPTDNNGAWWCPFCLSSYFEDNADIEYKKSENDIEILEYCNECNIVFGQGCYALWCDCGNVWPMLITEWIYDEKYHKSTPIFKNVEDARDLIENKKIKIIKYQCICNNDKEYINRLSNNRICKRTKLEYKNECKF